MQLTELSVILPVRNIQNEVSGILRYIASQAENTEAEFIVVDMGSTDQTVLESVQTIKELQLRGCVIQNGYGSVSTALNTGIQKSSGDFITFIFARRLYRDFIKGYLNTAKRTQADFIFGSISENDSKFAQRRSISNVIKKANGTTHIKDLILGNLHIDISAIMLNRKFLLQKQISFFEDCDYGYAEEFVYRCLLNAEIIVQSPTIIKRDSVFELKRGKIESIGKDIFQYVDAIQRIADIIKTDYKDSDLNKIFTYEKLPDTVMHCIDIMLKEGNGYNSIRGFLKITGYSKLLLTNKQTNNNLKRRVLCWRTIPWMYKPRK